MNYLQGQKFREIYDNNKIYYCDTHDVNSFFDNINFTHDFVLVSHNSDGNITDNPTIIKTTNKTRNKLDIISV